MLLSLERESEFEAVLNGSLNLTLGEKLSTNISFSIDFAPYFPACLNHSYLKLQLFTSLLNILLYSVVFVLTS